LSKKFESIIKKYAKKERSRVRNPTTVDDYMTNLVFDIKFIQLFLNGLNASNVKNMDSGKLEYKINRAKMGSYQAVRNIEQIIHLLMTERLMGDIDFSTIIPRPINFTPPKKEKTVIEGERK